MYRDYYPELQRLKQVKVCPLGLSLHAAATTTHSQEEVIEAKVTNQLEKLRMDHGDGDPVNLEPVKRVELRLTAADSDSDDMLELEHDH